MSGAAISARLRREEYERAHPDYWRMAHAPGTDLVIDPRTGTQVLFRHAGAWTIGEVVTLGDLRVGVKRPGFSRVYWRNKTQLYRPRAEP